MVELAIAGAVYSTFCAFLIFPHLGAPKLISRLALVLCAAQLASAAGWSVAHQNCGGATSGDAVFNQPCPAIAGVFAAAVPILVAVFFAGSVAYGLLVARRWYSGDSATG